MQSNFDLYKKMPFTVKHSLKYAYSLIPLRWRLGKKFFKELDFLEKSQWWSKEELEQYQNEQLRNLVQHAYDNVPYYNRVFKANKLSPSDIKTKQDLYKIPLLSKDIVRQNVNDFIARNFNKRDLVVSTTSGTSGKVFKIYIDPKSAFIFGGPFAWRFYRFGGCNFDDLFAVFRAFFYKYKTFGKEHILQYNPAQRTVCFSVYDIADNYLNDYLDGLKKFPLKAIQGYPGPLKMLVDILIKNGIKKPFSPKAIFTISEMLPPECKVALEHYFECQVFDWYGMAERTVLACDCDRGNKHINSEFGIAEFVREESTNSEMYEIVATGFKNYAMPFIRYKTEDFGTAINSQCTCGRRLPLLKLLGGRNRNFIIDSENNLRYVIGDLDKFSDFLSQYQYVQIAKGKVKVRIISTGLYNQKMEKIIVNHLKKIHGDRIIFQITATEKIQQTSKGKIPLVLSENN